MKLSNSTGFIKTTLSAFQVGLWTSQTGTSKQCKS